MKKFIALLTVFALLASFAACSKTDAPPPFEETERISETQILQTDNSTVQPSDIETSQQINTTENVSETQPVTETVADPSTWTDEEIIEFYKQAAEKTNPTAKSTQVMDMTELIINDGDGALGFFIKILEPAIASVIKKNALDFDGITGGFANLEAADAKNLKAYKSGNYTVIEMAMNNQTDSIHADANAGSVGHAVSVLGDISKVLAEFPQFDVDVENADIKVHYVNATVKVRINENGIIEKGTWKYTCDPEIKHLDISGIMIDKADAKIDYIITVGGGF